MGVTQPMMTQYSSRRVIHSVYTYACKGYVYVERPLVARVLMLESDVRTMQAHRDRVLTTKVLPVQVQQYDRDP